MGQTARATCVAITGQTAQASCVAMHSGPSVTILTLSGLCADTPS